MRSVRALASAGILLAGFALGTFYSLVHFEVTGRWP